MCLVALINRRRRKWSSAELMQHTRRPPRFVYFHARICISMRWDRSSRWARKLASRHIKFTIRPAAPTAALPTPGFAGKRARIESHPSAHLLRQ